MFGANVRAKITVYVNNRIHSATLLVYGLDMIRKVGEALIVSQPPLREGTAKIGS